MTFAAPTISTEALKAGDPPATQIVFGITFNLNGQLVPISTADIANAKTKGVDLALPGPVVLGTIDDFTAWFLATFKIALPTAADFPPPLNGIFAKITSLRWTVNAAHVHVFPDTTPTLYTLSVTAEWIGDGIPLIPGILTIQGAVFGVTNEPPKE